MEVMPVNPSEPPKKRRAYAPMPGKKQPSAAKRGGDDTLERRESRGTSKSKTAEKKRTAAKVASAAKRQTAAPSQPPRGSRKSRTTSAGGTTRSGIGPGVARPSRGPRSPRVAPGRAVEVQAIAKDLGSDLDALRSKVDAIAVRVGEEPIDPFGAMGEIFADELRMLLGDALPDSGAVRRAARLAVADQAWSQRLGSLLDTRDVVELLDVSKQRVSALAREHRLIALPQRGRQRFPAWQFAASEPEDRACLAAAHRQLVEVGALSAWTAASWFQQEHPELGGRDPVTYLRKGGDRAQLLRVAARDADRLAQ
jgi:hypothetical protein